MFVARSQKVRGEKYKIVQKRKRKRERGKREREKGRENYGNALLFRDNSIEFAHTRNTKPRGDYTTSNGKRVTDSEKLRSHDDEILGICIFDLRFG